MSYPPTKKAFLLRVSLGDVHLIFCLAGYKCMYLMNGYFLHIVLNYKNGVLQTVTPFKNLLSIYPPRASFSACQVESLRYLFIII